MYKRLLILTLLITFGTSMLLSQEDEHEPLVFPTGLEKYLPDSLKGKVHLLMDYAISKNLSSEYLWSFLPDSIQKFLPDSIEKFIEKQENTMDNQILFTAKDLMSIRRLSSISISPDGNWVLYTLKNPRIKGNRFSTDIFAANTKDNRIIKLTKHGKSDYSPMWSPDGKNLLWMSNRNQTPQIFMKEFPEGEVIKMTKNESGVSNINISPDGKYFSYSVDVKMKDNVHDKYTAYKKAKVRIYDELPIRHWSEWTDEFYSHPFYAPINGGEEVDIMKDEMYESPLKPFGGGEQIAWSQDAKEIAYVSKKIDNYVQSTNSDIYVYDLASKKTINITSDNKGFDLDPQYSPNNKWIAYVSQENDGFESDRRRLMLYNRDSKEIEELTTDFDYWVGEYIWTPDSKSIIYTAGHKGTVKIFMMDIDSKEYKIIADGLFNHSNLSISDDGNTLAFGKESMVSPMEIYVMNMKDFSQKKLTSYSEMVMNKVKKPTIEEKWVTAVDGASIHCWVVYPPDFDESKKYPLITYCQGGPQSMIGQRFHFRWNYMLMASHGYVVILPNRRGVPGFGQDWNDAISLDWGGKPMQDIMSATDIMLKKPFIDPNGSCAIGASAGGYAAFWLAGNHQGRYKAFAAHCGVFNLESMYGSTEELWFPDWEYGGPYWEEKNKDYYDKHSPHRYSQNWDTPILISTGEYDFRVPYTQSLEAFTVAQVKGLDSKLLVFPEETHFIAHPQEFIIWDSEFFEFLDKHCKH